MKRRIIWSALALAAALPLAAAQTGLRLTLADGSQPTYILDEKPTVTFEGENVLISTPDAETAYPRAQVVSFTFADDTSVANLPVESQSVLRYTGKTAEAEGQAIRVYDLGGREVRSASDRVSLEGLAAGIYAVTAGKQSIKIIGVR